MIFGAIIFFAVGSVCIILGFLIWKKQKLSLLHDYHYQNVKKEDIPAYTGQMGAGMIVLGAGIAAAGIFELASSSFWWIPLSAGIVIGLIVMYRAQKKYNRSIFS